MVDAANVVGSRPTGWWRDRPGAARRLVERVGAAVAAGTVAAPVVIVVEGAARPGVAPGPAGPGVEVVHAPGSGDDTIVGVVGTAVAAGDAVRVVTADRGLRDRVGGVGATTVGPRWLWDRIDGAEPARDRT